MKDASSLFVDDFIIKSLPLRFRLEHRLYVSHIFGYITYALMSLFGNFLFFQIWGEKQKQWATLENQSSQLKELAYSDGLTGVIITAILKNIFLFGLRKQRKSQGLLLYV